MTPSPAVQYPLPIVTLEGTRSPRVSFDIQTQQVGFGTIRTRVSGTVFGRAYDKVRIGTEFHALNWSDREIRKMAWDDLPLGRFTEGARKAIFETLVSTYSAFQSEVLSRS